MSTNEWYTPSHYIEAAREVMGGIDLEPGSLEFGNRVVQATHYYTRETNGLTQPWRGRIWLNPPYGKTEQAQASNLEIFTRRLIEQYDLCNVTQAILLIPANTATSWFDLLWQFPICFPASRIRFYQENGEPSNGVSFGTCFVYLGLHEARFAEIFSRFPRPIARELWTEEAIS